LGVPAIYRGQAAKSNGVNAPSFDGCAGRGTYGLQFQCVEYIKRFAGEALNLNSRNWSGNAVDFFSDTSIAQTGLVRHRNGEAQTPPEPGDILVFGPTNTNQFGHIAVVHEVTDSTIRVIEQNWPPDVAPVLSLTHQPSGYRVGPRVGRISTYTTLGWLRAASTTPNPVTYAFAGNVTGFWENSQAAFQALGINVSIGTRFSATFTYDANAPRTRSTPSNHFDNAVTDFVLLVAGREFRIVAPGLPLRNQISTGEFSGTQILSVSQRLELMGSPTMFVAVVRFSSSTPFLPSSTQLPSDLPSPITLPQIPNHSFTMLIFDPQNPPADGVDPQFGGFIDLLVRQ